MADVLTFVKREQREIHPLRISNNIAIPEISFEPGMNVHFDHYFDDVNQCLEKITYNDGWHVFIDGRDVYGYSLNNLQQNKKMPWFNMPYIRASEIYSFQIPKILSINNMLKYLGKRKDMPFETKTVEARVMCSSTVNPNTAVYLYDDKAHSLYIAGSKSLRD